MATNTATMTEGNELYQEMMAILDPKFNHLVPILQRLHSMAIEFDLYHIQCTLEGFDEFVNESMEELQELGVKREYFNQFKSAMIRYFFKYFLF